MVTSDYSAGHSAQTFARHQCYAPPPSSQVFLYPRSSQHKATCSFPALRSCCGGRPRRFFQRPVQGVRHPCNALLVYIDSFNAQSKTPDISLSLPLPKKNFRLPLTPRIKLPMIRVMSRTLSVLRVICSQHHPHSVKCSQGCLYGFPPNPVKCHLTSYPVLIRIQFASPPQAHRLIRERSLMIICGGFLDTR